MPYPLPHTQSTAIHPKAPLTPFPPTHKPTFETLYMQCNADPHPWNCFLLPHWSSLGKQVRHPLLLLLLSLPAAAVSTRPRGSWAAGAAACEASAPGSSTSDSLFFPVASIGGMHAAASPFARLAEGSMASRSALLAADSALAACEEEAPSIPGCCRMTTFSAPLGST